MVYRKFNAPNVEYNEIDKSQYGVINNAAVGTMTMNQNILIHFLNLLLHTDTLQMRLNDISIMQQKKYFLMVEEQ